MSYPLHDLNQGFEWSPHTGPFDILTDQQVAAFDQDGFFLFENAFTQDELAEVTAAIDPLEAEIEAFLRTQKDSSLFINKADAITFAVHLVAKSKVARAFSKHPVLTRITRDLLGDNVRLYWDQSVYKKPENPRAFPYHQDNGYTFITPQVYLTCWIPLVDTTERNGCPWVVPRLHRLGTLKHKTTNLGYEIFKDHENEVCVPAKAGDIVVFSSLTPHKTGPNLTRHTRKAYILQYAPDGVVQRKSLDAPGARQDAEERQYFVVKDGQAV